MTSFERFSRCAVIARWIGCAVAVAAGQSIACEGPPRSGPHVVRIGKPSLRVLDIAPGQPLWIATRGGGVFGIDGAAVTHFDVGRRLPSAVTWQVTRSLGGGVLVGTADGLVHVDPAAADYRCIEPVGVPPAHGLREADIVRVLPSAGPAFVQLSDRFESRQWHLGTNALIDPPEGVWPGTATATSFDLSSNCLDVAGVQATTLENFPWVVGRCAGIAALQSWAGSAQASLRGIAAVARDPQSGTPVLAIVRQQGENVTTRKYVLMQPVADGTLAPHCSGAEFASEVTGMVSDPAGHRLVVAVYGKGLVAVSCDTPSPPAIADHLMLRTATALAIEPGGRLLVGTDNGLFALDRNSTAPVALLVADADVVPPDAIPADSAQDGNAVLLSSPTEGVVEVTRVNGQWSVARRWRRGMDLPEGVYGTALYGPGNDILVIVHSQGVRRVGANASDWLAGFALPVPPLLVQMVVDGDGGVWVGTGATPVNPNGGGVHLLRKAQAPLHVAMLDRQVQPAGSMLAMDDGIWMATRSGIVRADASGTLRRLSQDRVQSLFRNAATSRVAAVGATIQRWTPSEGFTTVSFGLPQAELRDPGGIGHPIDVVVDDQDRWTILYSSGKIVLLDAQRKFQALLGVREGIPWSSRKLLHLKGDDIMIGTAREGVFLLRR
ncbi:MAG TPA: hypothetical protein VF169_23760 [Albitalea sp.]|uniref:hypothetical protein n=1 Tax=Piscinibacter sp. TaxID=1903157 RepID=UPI002ED2C44C